MYYEQKTATLEPYAHAALLESQPNIWKPNIKIVWTPADNTVTDGKWYVYRYIKSEGESARVLLTPSGLGYSTTQWVDDSNLEYDIEYVYEVSFGPNAWGTQSTPEPSLTRSVETALVRDFKIKLQDIEALTKDEVSDGLKLTWTHEAMEKDVTFVVYRRVRPTDENGKALPDGDPLLNEIPFEQIAEVPRSNASATSHNYIDREPSNICDLYDYKITAEILGKNFESNFMQGTITGGSRVKSVYTSKGTYSNIVKVTWEALQVGKDPTKFVVMRRQLGTDAGFSKVYTTQGTASEYYFEDNTVFPGNFYEYMVEAYAICGDNYTQTSYLNNDGFSQSTGIISGRITYGTGTAVEGVKVVLTQSGDDENIKSQFYALKVGSANSGVSYDFGNDNTPAPFAADKPFSVQLWTKINSNIAVGEDVSKPAIVSTEAFMLYGEYNASKNNYSLKLRLNGAELTFDKVLEIAADKYSHITLGYDGKSKWTLRTLNNEGDVVTTVTATSAAAPAEIKTLRVGNALAEADIVPHTFKGMIDEIRVWSKELSDAELLNNHNRLIVGNESGIALYWPIDEGIADQATAYDYSKTGGVPNERHGSIQMGTSISTDVPEASRFSLYGLTDAEGNYVIRGVPFSGEGTNYVVTPLMGIHEFSPAYVTRFVSANSLTHSGADMEDVSSFPVSGVIYYEGTNYPVEGVSLYVDGMICNKDGKALTTNEKGEFEISVPIGQHYITAQKNGHTFVNNGRFPADPNDVRTTVEFNQELKNLRFFDNTLVKVVGRVVGGEIEEVKPIGMGLSSNNIGQASVTLTAGTYSMNWVDKGTNLESDWTNSDVEKPLSIPADAKVASEAKVGAGEDAKTITILTDKNTGEFAVMLPPVQYTAKIKVKSNDKILFDNLPIIDASNPLVSYTDSVEMEDGSIEKFSYNASLIEAYRAKPTFTVTDKGAADGAYGEESYTVADVNGKNTKVTLYRVEADGSIHYNYENPVFVQNNKYNFELKGYEEYVNYDGEQPVASIVPLSGTIVTIQNQMSSIQSVRGAKDETAPGEIVDLKDNELELDENGEATYSFIVGFPNIVEAQGFARGLNISFENNGEVVNWDGNSTFKGIILGSLPTGTNFVTAGPDKVLMVLRDPGGSNSSSSWSKGTSRSYTEKSGGTFTSNTSVETLSRLGVDFTVASGTFVFQTITEVESKFDLTVGLHINAHTENSTTRTTTTTTTRTISTSKASDYVGAMGDVFIGCSTNILFGNARAVALIKDAASGEYMLGLKDAMIYDSQFTTEFSYTQYYIENILIPNLETIRNSMFTQVSESEYSSFVNNTDHNIYITTLSPDDPRFGSSNYDEEVWGKDATTDKRILEGPSYKVVKPKTFKKDVAYRDSVGWYNEQIDTWIEKLYLNEQAKVRAIDDRQKYLDHNLSFDNGVSIEGSVEKSELQEDFYSSETDILLYGGFDTGTSINDTGVILSVREEIGGGVIEEEVEGDETVTAMTYTIADEGHNDALTIDVFNAPDGFGPIFVSRGGQTRCPYEDEAKTKYYRPGTTISAKTMMVEDPVITVDEAVATDVPAGGVANYVVRLSNNSETGDDVWFDLALLDETNPNGAKLTMDGAVITTGRSLVVPAGGELVKSLQLTQTDESVLDYEDIQLVLQSQCQGDPTGTFPVLADTISISAYFVPSCSDITLHIPETTMNTQSGSVLSMRVEDFNLTYRNFNGLRIQYKYANDVDWKLAREFVVDPKDVTLNNSLIEGAPIDYKFDMSNSSLFPDGVYTFRAITMCDYGNGEINNESAEITVIKDMARPQILGTPNPADGILEAGDDIFVTFNEDIRSGALSKDLNFKVTGVLNGAEIAHGTSLQLTGSETAAARTEAEINLNKQSFAMDMWLKLESAGTIIEHGAGLNKFTVSVDAGKHLVVGIGSNTYTSIRTVPFDTWAYLTVSYDFIEGASKLNARLSYDSSEVSLFADAPVADYIGVGALSVGKKLTGAIHELALWGYARTLDESQRDMHYTKYAYTPNLIGYWKMDEGQGTLVSDDARSRHMTSAGNWALNNANYAANFNGSSSHANLDITRCSVLGTDDYTIELWFKGATQNNATLFSVDEKKLTLKSNSTGKLVLVADGVETQLSDDNYLDDKWHHFALNVLRNGSSIAYIDGVNVKQIASSGVPALASDAIVLGATRYFASESIVPLYRDFFKGDIDEVRFWNAKLTNAVIKENIYSRLDTVTATGLVAYYPFETLVKDAANGQIKAQFSTDDQSVNKGTSQTVGVVQASSAPGLKEAPASTNLDFSFTASDKQVYINLGDSPARLEGTTVKITLREVYDMNYNRMQDVVWSVYVNKNRLNWSDKEMVISRSIDDEANEFNVAVINKGSETEQWSITGVPAWLKVSDEQGSIKALESKELKFTVPASTPIGKYEATMYLSGNDGIYVPFTVSLTVTGKRPNWNVNPADFELTMNMVGQLQVDGVVTEDADDLVAAFVGDLCVGVASPIYYSRYDSYYVHMTVYGNESELTKPVTFKMWDASTGDIYPQVSTSEAVTFVSNKLTGSMSNPFIWNAKEQREQVMTHNKGWNWISLYVAPEADAATLNDIFNKNIDSFSQIKSEDKFSEPSDGIWIGTIDDMSVGKLYKVQTNAPVEMSVYGKGLVAADNPITIMPKWNWIGFNSSVRMLIDDAFAGLNPKSGDLVKGQNGFSVYEDYQWVGTLAALTPGQGYMYQSTASENKVFTYPAAPRITSNKAPKMQQAKDLDPDVFTPVGVNMYPGTMTIIGKVKRNDEFVNDVEVGAFVGDECRGAIKSMESGLVFLSIFGEVPNEKISLKVSIDGVVYSTFQELFYVEDSSHGKVKSPFVIEVKETTGVEDIIGDGVEIEVYNLQGFYLGNNIENLINGYYIINGKKVYVKDGKIFRF